MTTDTDGQQTYTLEPLTSGQRQRSWLPAGLRRMWRRRLRWRPRGSTPRSLVSRILIINTITLVIPVIGFFYTDQYRKSLIDAELEALRSEGRIIAVALGSAAATGEDSDKRLDEDRSALFLRLLTIESPSRARLFALNGDLLADSIVLHGGAVPVYAESLGSKTLLERLSPQEIWAVIRRAGRTYAPYVETSPQRADHYPEAAEALFGEVADGVRASQGNSLVLSAAVPVQEYRRVLGALMLSRETTIVDERIAEMQALILGIFLIALVITILLSIYLASTIARPVRQLAKSADLVRRQKDRRHSIPNLSDRGDEIGDLSLSLREMTETLWARIDSMETFAADVAHELKNPLTSLRSAFETLSMVKDPKQQAVLLDILTHDVDRMDRLITDISDSSRLDAELARSSWDAMDLHELATNVIELQTQMDEGRTQIILEPASALPQQFTVLGAEVRLGQVLVNLITNAQTFAPEGSKIWVRLKRSRSGLLLSVEDQGPGFPADKLNKVFERFYTDRPEQEGFGNHSGLGLSISKQIITAHGGEIWAENAGADDGEITGARVVLRLPELPEDFRF